MSAHVLNLSCIGRDALVQDWGMGTATAEIVAYRVFETENGYGVAYQAGVLDLQTQRYTCDVVPTQLTDGSMVEAEAIERMRWYAQWERDERKEGYEQQEIAVLCGVVKDEVRI